MTRRSAATPASAWTSCYSRRASSSWQPTSTAPSGARSGRATTRPSGWRSAAREVPVLEAAEDPHERPQHREIDERRDDDGRGVVGQALRLAGLEQELGHGDDAAEGCELHYLERVGEEIR